MSKAQKVLKKHATKVAQAAAIVSGVVISSGAMALTEAENTAVTNATTSGATSIGLVVTGLIAMAAVVTGFGIVYGMLRK